MHPRRAKERSTHHTAAEERGAAPNEDPNMATFQTNMIAAETIEPTCRPLGLVARIAQMAALYTQRKELAAFDAHQLDDLGLTRDAADAEAARPVWDAPYHWIQGSQTLNIF